MLVSGTMEMQGVFRLAEFVTGRAVVTGCHKMVNLEPILGRCLHTSDGRLATYGITRQFKLR